MTYEERAAAIEIIRVYAGALTEEASDLARRRALLRTHAPEPALLRAACERQGASLWRFWQVLNEDASLRELLDKSQERALAGEADPGPYDAISRESPTAREGDLSKPRLA